MTEELITDYELTSLCAESMGYTCAGTWDTSGMFVRDEKSGQHFLYCPQRNGNQTLDLIKTHLIRVGPSGYKGIWTVTYGSMPFVNDRDLNYAVCKAVALMMKKRKNDRL